jgi:predicted ArsR family transcriptional regulator
MQVIVSKSYEAEDTVVNHELQQEARALGDRTRHRLFRYIVDAPGPVGVAELTQFVHLNHNAVRQHLAILKEAGLVAEEIEKRSRPGRPGLLYRAHPEAAGKWNLPGAYSWLATLLSDAIRSGQSPREVGRQDGNRRAAELVGSAEGVELLEAEITRRGFRPQRVQRGRRIDFVLQRCPFADVAESDPDTVCQLHLGLAEGLAEGLGGLMVERLTVLDPRQAGCCLTILQCSVDGAANI